MSHVHIHVHVTQDKVQCIVAILYTCTSYTIIYLWAETSARRVTTRAIAIIQSEEYTPRWIAHICKRETRKAGKE